MHAQALTPALGLVLLCLMLASCTPLVVDDDDPTIADDDDSAPAPQEPPEHLRAFWELCEQTPTIPEGLGYEGLLTDTHVHTNVGQEPLDFASALLGEMNEVGVDRVVVQSDHFAPMASRLELDLGWAELLPWCGRVEYLVGAFDPEGADSPAYVTERLDDAPYAGVGELDIRHISGQLSADPEAAPLLLIYADLVERGLGVHLQVAVDPIDPLYGAQTQVMANHPDLPFVWLGCSGFDLPAELTNVACTVLPERDPLLPPSPEAIEAHFGRSVIGSDMSPAGYPNPAGELLGWDSFAEAMLDARAELGERELPDEIEHAFARGNFDRTWADRR